MNFLFSSFFNLNPFNTRQNEDNDVRSVVLTPNREVIAITEPKIQSNTHSDTDEFVQVDLRKLSYAEIASLKSVANNGCPVLNLADLGTDVTDYQMAEQFKKQRNCSIPKKIPNLDPKQVNGNETILVGSKHTAKLKKDSTIDEMVDRDLINEDEAVKNYNYSKKAKARAKLNNNAVAEQKLGF